MLFTQTPIFDDVDDSMWNDDSPEIPRSLESAEARREDCYTSTGDNQRDVHDGLNMAKERDIVFEEDLTFSGRGERVAEDLDPSTDERCLADGSSNSIMSDMPSIFLSEPDCRGPH